MLPKHRQPTTPGEILQHEFLEPLKMTQAALAKKMGVSGQTVNLLINGKRSITAETALALADVFGTTPQFWMHAQANLDLWKALRARTAA